MGAHNFNFVLIFQHNEDFQPRILSLTEILIHINVMTRGREVGPLNFSLSEILRLKVQNMWLKIKKINDFETI